MSVRQTVAGLFQLAVVAACVYGIWKWQGSRSQGDDTQAFARQACADAIRSRYDVANARVYGIKKNSSGYVVNATVTLPRGNAAKVICLTNPNGGVRDVMLDER